MRPSRYGAFGYPLAGDGREGPLVACWILVMVAFLLPLVAVLPLALLLGYLVGVLEASACGDPAPQFLGDLRGIGQRAVGATVVAVGYLLVPVLALLITVYGAITGVQVSDPGSGESLLLYGGSTVVLCLFLLAFYLTPAALATYGHRESIRAAFASDRVARVAKHAAYFARWMAGAVALSMGAALANVALQIHRAGPIVASLILAYAAVLAAHVWGLGVGRARAS